MDSADTPGARTCTNDELLRSHNGDTSVHCLTRGQIVGETLVILSAFVSFLAVLYVFVAIMAFSIFLGEAIQALGEILNIKWVNDGKVKIGAYCTAQGVLKQLGQVSVPLSVLLLAIYTFRGLWIGRTSESLLLTKLLITGIWGFIILMVVLGNVLNLHKDEQHRYIAPVPYWCWIGNDYLQWRIWGEYFWWWLTLTVSILTYTPLFFWIRGTITPHPKSWWRFQIRQKDSVEANEFPKDLRNEAKIMLAYVPHLIQRWQLTLS
ncbi:hypothetical protein H1R20_g5104, partial [Candolleomyces eurysporus]